MRKLSYFFILLFCAFAWLLTSQLLKDEPPNPILLTEKASPTDHVKLTATLANTPVSQEIEKKEPFPNSDSSEENFSMPRDIMREAEMAQDEWGFYRKSVYDSFELSEKTQLELENIREKFSNTFDELGEKLERASTNEANNLLDQIKNKGEEFDSAVEKLIGKEKFQYLVQSRDEFNVYLDQRTTLRPRVNHSW